MSEPESNSLSDGRRNAAETQALWLLHQQIGWWLLLIFLTLGILLESFHGFKVRMLLDVSNETRRLMWRLAHTHGTLLGLVHIAFANAVISFPRWSLKARRIASPCLTGAGILMPMGFFLGGVFIHSGDPGMGVVLVPIGAFLLLAGVLITLQGVRTGRGARRVARPVEEVSVPSVEEPPSARARPVTRKKGRKVSP